MTLLDWLSSEFEILEVRRFPFSRDLHTDWVLRRKLFGYWFKFNPRRYYAYDCEFWSWYESPKSARAALVERLGPTYYLKMLAAGKLTERPLPKLEWGLRILPNRLFAIARGYYDKVGSLTSFTPCETVFESESIKEVVMRAEVSGLRVDNISKYGGSGVDDPHPDAWEFSSNG